MKKILILLSIFMLCACTKNESTIIAYNDQDINEIVSSTTYANTTAKGFKYYKPRDFALIETDEYNHILVHNSSKYYLNVDINAYYDKVVNKYKEDENLFYSKKIESSDGKSGYIEIKDGNNSYFYIKVLYNYSTIEVSVKKNEIYDAVIDSMIILSSIRYNDNVIENIISDGDLDSRESAYEIKKPKVKIDRSNVLDVYDYANSEGTN